MATQIGIANLDSFLASVRQAQASCSDLSEPLTAIAKDWFNTNKALFNSSGPGIWADFAGPKSRPGKKSPERGYREEKLRKWGFTYPIGRASGAMELSVTDPSDPNAYFEIVGGNSIAVASRVVSKEGAPYPSFFFRGTRKMPARPFPAVSQLTVSRWQAILRAFLVSKVTASGSKAA